MRKNLFTIEFALSKMTTVTLTKEEKMNTQKFLHLIIGNQTISEFLYILYTISRKTLYIT